MNTNNSSPSSFNNADRGRMTFVYYQRPDDKERIQEFYDYYKKLNHDKLILDYNRNCRIGFVGVHAQGLAMIAMHFLFIKRYGKSPFSFEDNILLNFMGFIELTNEGWAFMGDPA